MPASASTCIHCGFHAVKLKWSRYRPGVAQRVGKGIALLFHDRGTRSGWVVSSKPRPHFTPGKDPVPILQVAGWAPGPVWTGGKSRHHRDSISDPPARSQSLYGLSYRAHGCFHTVAFGTKTKKGSVLYWHKYFEKGWALLDYYAASVGNFSWPMKMGPVVPKRRYEIIATRCVLTQKSAVHIYFAAKA